MKTIRLTVTETADSILRQFGAAVPDWKIRRTFDAMERAESLDVQRMGRYRTIDADDVGKVAAELQRLGWLPKAEVVPC